MKTITKTVEGQNYKLEQEGNNFWFMSKLHEEYGNWVFFKSFIGNFEQAMAEFEGFVELY